VTAATRPMRADARRNRDAVLRAAATVFAAEGITAPLDDIATAAGIGNATLYRNFPTRDDLLAAVMADSVDALLADSEVLEAGVAPAEALSEWMFRLAWGLRIWQDLPTCIASAVRDGGSPVRPVSERLTDRTAELLTRARPDGGVTAGEVFQLLTAVSWAVDRFGDDEAAARRRVALATVGVLGS
jgi:AcrR family transcriptional regulator